MGPGSVGTNSTSPSSSMVPQTPMKFSFAQVDFVDQKTDPVTSVGEVVGTHARISLPRDEFPAFWHAIRDGHGTIQITWSPAGKDNRDCCLAMRCQLEEDKAGAR